MENRRKIEPKEIPSRLIPRLLVVFTRQLEVLVTTLGGVGGGGGDGKRYGLTAGGLVREQELVASLQMLLEKVHIGQFATEPDNE